MLDSMIAVSIFCQMISSGGGTMQRCVDVELRKVCYGTATLQCYEATYSEIQSIINQLPEKKTRLFYKGLLIEGSRRLQSSNPEFVESTELKKILETSGWRD